METMYHLRFRETTSSVASMRPHAEQTHDSTADVSLSLSLPILSPQVTGHVNVGQPRECTRF